MIHSYFIEKEIDNIFNTEQIKKKNYLKFIGPLTGSQLDGSVTISRTSFNFIKVRQKSA